MNIEDIQSYYNSLFEKYKIQIQISNFPMDKMQAWSLNTEKRLNLKPFQFNRKVAAFFWALSQVEFSLGYTLIARKDAKYPQGIKGETFIESEIPNTIELADLHFWHHLFCSWDCIYRCWERITVILKEVCLPDYPNKLYFDSLVDTLSDIDRFRENTEIGNLRKQIKNWNIVAKNRNKISHEESSPFRQFILEGEPSRIYNDPTSIYIKFSFKAPNLIEEFTNIKNNYMKLTPAFFTVKDFIDNVH